MLRVGRLPLPLFAKAWIEVGAGSRPVRGQELFPAPRMSVNSINALLFERRFVSFDEARAAIDERERVRLRCLAVHAPSTRVKLCSLRAVRVVPNGIALSTASGRVARRARDHLRQVEQARANDPPSPLRRFGETSRRSSRWHFERTEADGSCQVALSERSEWRDASSPPEPSIERARARQRQCKWDSSQVATRESASRIHEAIDPKVRT
jgi:hypothetical protein